MSDVQLDISDILKAKRPNQQKAWVLLDPGLRDQMDVALDLVSKREADVDRKGGAKGLAAAEALLDELEAEVAGSRVQFVFQSIGRKAYSTLLDANKPRDDDADDEDLGFNVDTFPPRLLALSCVNPKMNLKQATEIWNDWGDTQTTLLLTKAIVANKEIVDIPFTRSGTKMEMLTTALRSTTPQAAESPTPSS